MKKQKKPKNKQFQDNGDYEEPEIDIFQFDRNNGKTWSPSGVLNGDNNNITDNKINILIRKYWSKTDTVMTPIPIISIKDKVLTLLSLDDYEDVEHIKRETVLEFYVKSEELMKFDMIQMLKQERTRWHPDKFVNTETITDNSNSNSKNHSQRVLLATHLFQIINGLWESYH